MADPWAEPTTGLPSFRARWAAPTATDTVTAVGLAAAVSAFAFDPHTIADGPVICPFRRLTGLPCPGCGLTRAWVYAAHGWWRESFLANPFAMVLLAAVVGLAVFSVRARVRREPPPDLDVLIRNRWVIGVVAAWLVFAVVRAGVDLAT